MNNPNVIKAYNNGSSMMMMTYREEAIVKSLYPDLQPNFRSLVAKYGNLDNDQLRSLNIQVQVGCVISVQGTVTNGKSAKMILHDRHGHMTSFLFIGNTETAQVYNRFHRQLAVVDGTLGKSAGSNFLTMTVNNIDVIEPPALSLDETQGTIEAFRSLFDTAVRAAYAEDRNKVAEVEREYLAGIRRLLLDARHIEV